MAATYRPGLGRRVVNALVRAMLQLGVGPPRTYLLTVPGRRTGRLRSTPVTLVEERGSRWLVAPYGEVAGMAVGPREWDSQEMRALLEPMLPSAHHPSR